MLAESNTPQLGKGGRRSGPRLTKGPKPIEPVVLSARDWDVYRAICSFKMDHDGCPPQVREMMTLARLSSTSVVTYHLVRLMRAGLI